MGIFTAPITVLIGVVVVWEIVTYCVYGGFVAKEFQELYIELEDVELRLNTYDANIMYVNKSPYISKVLLSTGFNYYINDLGLVPRWSPLDKKISDWFKEARRNHKQQKFNEIKNSIK